MKVVTHFSAIILFASVAFGVTPSRPNFIIIFTDDQGYGDLGCFGSPNIETPNIDRMADEGIRFTSFYAAPFCGPSRASLMTGSYPPRVSLAFNHSAQARTGINPSEITLAEVLKSQDYTTMLVGKWHLGDHPKFLPTKHGFDTFFGLPYSNDMWPFHPRAPLTENEDPRLTAARKRAEYAGFTRLGSYYHKNHPNKTPLPLMHNEKIIETNPDQSRLTTLYTEKALEFITANKDRPFFLYLAHAMPHVALAVSDKFKGKSGRGLYGDVIMEIDWSVGQILDRLKALGLDERTLVIYTSDNGPWLSYGFDGGSAGPLRDGKFSTYEGGIRVPCIMRWPKHIPAGRRTDEVAALMDLLPTFANLAGTSAPTDRIIDGKNILPLMTGQTDARSPHEYFYYFCDSSPGQAPNLQAIRDRQWKLHLKVDQGKLTGTELYNLAEDVGERNNRIEDFPETVQPLQIAAQKFFDELRQNIRPVGKVNEN